jgi:uncharacterized protein
MLLKSDNQLPKENSFFTATDGKLFISSAREAISEYLSSRKLAVPVALQKDPRFQKKLGCFVTLKSNDEEKSLRGCIGFPEPIYPLSRALTEASIAAATQDPRFNPITIEELRLLLVEVSILTIPSVIYVRSPKELPSQITIGEDGLIMRWPLGAGLLLPQVATEQGWDAREFLTNLSMKAGAPPDQWLVPGTQVLKFQALIFGEVDPEGLVKLLH